MALSFDRWDKSKNEIPELYGPGISKCAGICANLGRSEFSGGRPNRADRATGYLRYSNTRDTGSSNALVLHSVPGGGDRRQGCDLHASAPRRRADAALFQSDVGTSSGRPPLAPRERKRTSIDRLMLPSIGKPA
jgi:hypothetical protein